MSPVASVKVFHRRKRREQGSESSCCSRFPQLTPVNPNPMKRFFDVELESLRTHLLQMGDRAIEQTRLAIRALVEADLALADKVIAADDEIDKLEVQIDDEAIRYMTLRGPVAGELRLVIVGMKASHDLERVGDEA